MSITIITITLGKYNVCYFVLFSTGLEALIWYPIYRLWKDLRYGDYIQLINHPAQPMPRPQQTPQIFVSTEGYQRGYIVTQQVA